ncbi:hypothetical protein C1H46_001584 [Malus baccata]|uniref:CBS domain-containing protein n=1 Tax=Malus baccata TaxID=106549 RepID=A0A540NPH4_MALBA|nr:hypothetical protein C1H46_001584 [Malus baccata]
MASQGGSSRRSLSLTNTSLQDKSWVENPMIVGLTGERTVKRLRLSKALTVPENTSVQEACRRMAARRVDALLLTDSNALLCGILTDKDIATRVISRELDLEETLVSKVMTRNPIFVLSDTLAVEALQKMVQGSNTFVETLRERLFRPSLSTIIPESTKVLIVSPTDTVLMTTKKMQEMRVSSAVVTIDNKPRGILTSKDILMRVISQNLPPKTTLVEKVGNTAGASNEAATNMMQKFWDSAMALSPNDDDDESRSEGSLKLASESAVTGRSLPFPPSNFPNTFAFKLQDKRGQMHRFTCNIQNLTELITSIIQRMGDDIDRNNLPQILYEDEDRDKVILASDSDLVAAVDHAKQVGWKGLRLHLDYSGTRSRRRRGSAAGNVDYAYADSAWASAYNAAAAGAALAVGLGVLAYLKRSGN